MIRLLLLFALAIPATAQVHQSPLYVGDSGACLELSGTDFKMTDGTTSGTLSECLSGGGGAGVILGTSNVTYTGVATGSTTFPLDDTVVQSSEGDEYMTLAYEPQSATSKIIIKITANFSCNKADGAQVGMAVFKDSITDAIHVGGSKYIHDATDHTYGTLSTIAIDSAGSTDSRTYKVRIGGDDGTTCTFNGYDGSQYFSVPTSGIQIYEVSNE